MKPTDSIRSGAAGSHPPEDAGKTRRRDRITLAIAAGFGVIGLLLIVAMYPGYRFNHNVAVADRLLASGDYAKAIPHLLTIVQRYPDAWLRQQQLGNAYMALAKPEPREALKHYESAQSTNPELDLNEEIGICYNALGDEKRAMEYFAKVLAEQPDSPAANFFVGLQNLAAKHYREAAHCFQAAAADPKWDKRAEPYRRELAEAVLRPSAAAVPEATPTPPVKR